MEQIEKRVSGKLDEVTGRLVVQGDGWGKSKYSEKDMRESILSLTEGERALLLKAIGGVRISSNANVADVQNKYADDPATLLDVLDAVMSKRVSGARTEVAFKVTTHTKSYGTTSSITGDIDACYTWCMEHTEGGKPDKVGLVSSMVACFAKPENNTPQKEVFSATSNLKSYFPKENRVYPYIKSAMVNQPCPTTEMIERRFRKFVAMDSPGRKQVINDLVQSQPATLVKAKKDKTAEKTGCRLASRPGEDMLVKAIPTRAVNMPKSFPTCVDAISMMSSAIGSAKYGFGAMSRCHYDGISGLSKTVRDKYEYLTDYVHDDASVYLLDTKDANFALAFMRTILPLHNDKKFVVVYNQTGSVNRLKLMECINFKDKVATSVKAQGVVGMPLLQWNTFRQLDTYYVSFKSYSKGRGRKDELVSTSIDCRMSTHDVAASFKKYMYYGFVGAMSEDTKVYPSCRARDGTVIYTHMGCMDRRRAALQVFNCVKHSLLYPWYRYCFRFKVKGKYFFDGVREYKSEYDFRTASRLEEFVVDMGDEEVTAQVDDFFSDLEMRDKHRPNQPKVVVKSEEKTDDADFFASLDDEGSDSG